MAYEVEKALEANGAAGVRVLFTNSMLDFRAGLELYLLDLARHLRRVRETFPPHEALMADLASLRGELECLRGRLAFRLRQSLLDRPALQRIYSCLRRSLGVTAGGS